MSAYSIKSNATVTDTLEVNKKCITRSNKCCIALAGPNDISLYTGLQSFMLFNMDI